MKKMYITMLSAFLSMFLFLGCSDDNLIPGRPIMSDLWVILQDRMCPNPL